LFLIKKKSVEKYDNIFYEPNNLIYSSNKFYNKPNCTIDNSCIIEPDKTNLFPPDLMNLAKDSGCQYSYKLNKPIVLNNCIQKNPCKNINPKCDNTNMYPTITPNLSKNTLIKGQCPICKVSSNDLLEYYQNYKAPCCKQGINTDCNPICRGCKTGKCHQGWCFSRPCPVKKKCLYKKNII
jgi:hypothetical protein